MKGYFSSFARVWGQGCSRQGRRGEERREERERQAWEAAGLDHRRPGKEVGTVERATGSHRKFKARE